MFLNEEFHTVSDVLEEPGDDGFAHPRTVVHTVDGGEVFVSVTEVLVQPLVDRTDGFAQTERKHVPPFAGGDAVFTNPKRAEGGGGAVAVLHTSNGFSLNPKNGKLREEKQEEHNVDQGKGGDGEGEAAGAFLERCAFKEVDESRTEQPVLAEEEAYQIVPVIHDITSTVGLPNARIEAAHDGRNIRHFVPDHRLGNVRDGDEHR